MRLPPSSSFCLQIDALPQGFPLPYIYSLVSDELSIGNLVSSQREICIVLQACELIKVVN